MRPQIMSHYTTSTGPGGDRVLKKEIQKSWRKLQRGNDTSTRLSFWWSAWSVSAYRPRQLCIFRRTLAGTRRMPCCAWIVSQSTPNPT